MRYVIVFVLCKILVVTHVGNAEIINKTKEKTNQETEKTTATKQTGDNDYTENKRGGKTKTNEKELIDYYDNLITYEINKYDSWTLPENAEEYKGNYYDEFSTHEDLGEYNFVVIGGGSSGAVIASRLSEIKEWKILLLEAGERENNFTNIPGLYFYSRYSNFNWGYFSEPQKFACQGMVDKRCPYPRGRGLGGTSLINGVIYSRGHRDDFDLWNSYLPNGTWSYKHVLPYFKKSEHTYIPHLSPKYHGFNGPLPINHHKPTSYQTLKFLQAHKELNISITDINGEHMIGAALNQLITSKGQRVSTARAYLHTARPNLKILTGAYVTKIIFNAKTTPKQAVGVEFTYKRKKSKVRVTNEVILSAGVFGSPAILMHSGIGPIQTLLKHSISLIYHNSLVGHNLQDHATFYGLIFTSNSTEPIKTRREYIKEYLEAKGPYTIAANLEGISFHKTNLSLSPTVPDIELLFVPSNSTGVTSQRSYHLSDITYDTIWKHVNPTNSFEIYVILLKPRSVGYVTLRSGDPFDYPKINPYFLSDYADLDIESIYLGVQHVLKLIDTKAFGNINATLVKYTFPDCEDEEYLSKSYWYCTIRQMTMNVYHPMATCAMKNKPAGGVVDGSLKVYGVKRLRVVDASVIPFAISGHPHATAVMIAEKAADIIKAEYGFINL